MPNRRRGRLLANSHRAASGLRAWRLTKLSTSGGSQLPKVFIVGPAPGQLGGIASVMAYLEAQARILGSYDLRFLETMKDGRWSIVRFGLASVRLFLGIINCRISGQPVIVHLNVSVRGSTYRKWFLAQICRILSTPYLVHLHGGRYRTFLAGSSPLVKRMIFGLAQNATFLVVLGNVWRDFSVEHLRVDPVKIAVIPNGTPALPMPTAAVAASAENSTIRIVFAGRLDEKKGLCDLLAAADRLYEESTGFEILLLGDSRSLSLLQEAESRPYCRVTGWLPHSELVAYLASADIFTLPSHDEGLPMAMLEAMSLGLPVVVTAVGAIPDVIVDGQEGYLIQPRDVTRLFESLRCLIGSKSLRDKMGRMAYARWRKELGADRMTERIFAQWEAALTQAQIVRTKNRPC